MYDNWRLKKLDFLEVIFYDKANTFPFPGSAALVAWFRHIIGMVSNNSQSTACESGRAGYSSNCCSCRCRTHHRSGCSGSCARRRSSGSCRSTTGRSGPAFPG